MVCGVATSFGFRTRKRPHGASGEPHDLVRTMLLSRKERAPRRQAKNTARSARGNLRFEGGALADGKFTYAWFEGSKCTGEAFAKLNSHLP